jgi:hypothetical protein
VLGEHAGGVGAQLGRRRLDARTAMGEFERSQRQVESPVDAGGRPVIWVTPRAANCGSRTASARVRTRRRDMTGDDADETGIIVAGKDRNGDASYWPTTLAATNPSSGPGAPSRHTGRMALTGSSLKLIRAATSWSKRSAWSIPMWRLPRSAPRVTS